MVLINGVKYACERCIRGHRVTTCTHTDQPLTMIKPKGRPASQCLHCREQRKLKSLHISCTCGKKGKPPGNHLALCPCNKGTHCTCACATTSKKLDKSKKKTLRDQSDNELALFANKTEEEGGGASMPPQEGGFASNYVFEDMAENLDTNSGLFDLFSNQPDQFVQGQLNHLFLDVQNSASSSPAPSHSSNGHMSSATPQELQHTMKNPPAPSSDKRRPGEELMFPLFPLVGSCSFDDSESRPLLTLPGTHHPRPTAPNSHQHVAARPKRPESVLSLASNSSTATSQSRLNVQLESYFNAPSGPIQSNSAAYPPSVPESLSEGGANAPESSDRMFDDAEFFDQNPFNETHEMRLNEYENFIGAMNSQPSVRNGYPSMQATDMTQSSTFTPFKEPGPDPPLIASITDDREQFNIDFGGNHSFNELVSPVKFDVKDVKF